MSDSRTRHELSLDLPAAHRGVRIARNVVRHFARLQGVVDKDVDALGLVLSELLANAIDHGGGGAALSEEDLVSEVRMRMHLLIESDHWVLSVTDEGGGDADALRAALEDATFSLEDDRGRGLFLMREMVDRMEILGSDNGAGLTFRATKKHGGDEAGAGEGGG